MGNIGFNIDNEFLPSFDRFNSIKNQRLMFLKFFNQENCCDMHFTKEELNNHKNDSLFNIFVKKIIKNIQSDLYITSRIKKIDIEKTNKVNAFVKRMEKSNNFRKIKISLFNNLEEQNINLAIKLIDILEDCNYSLFLDGEKIFKNFVSNKILKGDGNREVYVNDDSIDMISEENNFYTKIFTFWEKLDSDNLKIDKHIQKAVECIKTSDFKQVYLVYPKNEKFNKHIQVKTKNITCSDYEIKLIPYSLRSTLR